MVDCATSDEEFAFMAAELDRLRSRAEAGDPQARRDLGCAYFWGEETYEHLLPRDLAQCRRWYSLAAEQGHHEAMWDVCHMLLRGEGGAPDVERGLRYLHFLASRRRYVDSACYAAKCLAMYYARGEYGLPVDGEKARYWSERMKDHRRYWRGYRRKFSDRRRCCRLG